MYCLRLLQNQHHILQIRKINGYIKYNIPVNFANKNIDTVNNLKKKIPAITNTTYCLQVVIMQYLTTFC